MSSASLECHSQINSPVSGSRVPAGQPYVGRAEEALLLPPDDPVSHQDHHHDNPQAEDAQEEWSDEDEVANMKQLPWWKRPSPYWLICALPFTAAATAATMAPRIEVYTVLACRLLRPDIYDELSVTAASQIIHSPTRSQLCAADPVVQAAVAKISAASSLTSGSIYDLFVHAAMTTSMGILSCLTTGWWGAFSDRYGRPRVMGISLIGLLLTDLNFIFVVLFPDYAPGGYWFLLFGPLVEGSLGGFTGAVAAMHAYQADVTSDHNRSRFFSLGLGLMFAGMAVGPTLGSLTIRWTGQLLSVFYASGIAHLIYALLIWCILPQSLSLSYRLRARKNYAEKSRADDSERSSHFGVRLLLMIKRAFAFLAPLAVFTPRVQENNNPLKKTRSDWNLTLMGLTYIITVSIMGSYNYKFQYAAAAFGWTSEELGYWLSLVGAARAIFLALILPVAIKILLPKLIAVEKPQILSESSPLLSSSESSQRSSTKQEVHSPTFDLGLARVSVFVELAAYTAMGLAPTPLAFTVFGMLGSMGTAFSPASQTVTLALYTQRGNKESGRLFGALSVLQALGSQILGPTLYGFVYVKTVATYPQAIFFLSVGTLIISALLLACVRLPKEQFSTTTKATDAEVMNGGSHRTSVRSRGAEVVEVEA